MCSHFVLVISSGQSLRSELARAEGQRCRRRRQRRRGSPRRVFFFSFRRTSWRRERWRQEKQRVGLQNAGLRGAVDDVVEQQKRRSESVRGDDGRRRGPGQNRPRNQGLAGRSGRRGQESAGTREGVAPFFAFVCQSVRGQGGG